VVLVGIIILVIGLAVGNRPIVWVGAALAIIGLVLLVASVPGPVVGHWY
jgi:membrane-bound ClpP family serine protease